MSKKTLWLVGGLVVVAVALMVGGSLSGKNNSQRSNREVALSCTTDMYTKFHIHPELEIIIAGQKQTLPASIGISLGCMHPLHTHDTSGVIHVESPEKRDFTLADFFAVWGKPFSKEEILDSKADATHRMVLTVNGRPSDQYENLILQDRDRVIISYEEIK